jgi:hypothetical protein
MALVLATVMARARKRLLTISDSGLAEKPFFPIDERYSTSMPCIRALRKGTVAAKNCRRGDDPLAEKLITSCA